MSAHSLQGSEADPASSCPAQGSLECCKDRTTAGGPRPWGPQTAGGCVLPSLQAGRVCLPPQPHSPPTHAQGRAGVEPHASVPEMRPAVRAPAAGHLSGHPALSGGRREAQARDRSHGARELRAPASLTDTALWNKAGMTGHWDRVPHTPHLASPPCMSLLARAFVTVDAPAVTHHY